MMYDLKWLYLNVMATKSHDQKLIVKARIRANTF